MQIRSDAYSDCQLELKKCSKQLKLPLQNHSFSGKKIRTWYSKVKLFVTAEYNILFVKKITYTIHSSIYEIQGVHAFPGKLP